MGKLSDSLSGLSALRWWIWAVLLFWGSTGLCAFLDFAGERWFGVKWNRGPDIFPNNALGYPLTLCHILAVVLLLASGVRCARSRSGMKGVSLGITIVIFTGAVCFVLLVLFSLWYQSDLMGRQL